MLIVLILCALKLSVERLDHLVQVVSSHGLLHRHLSDEELAITDLANLAFLLLASCIDRCPRKSSLLVEATLAICCPAELAVLDFTFVCRDMYLLATVAYLVFRLCFDWSCQEVDRVSILQLVLLLADTQEMAVLAERLQTALNLGQGFIESVLIFDILLREHGTGVHCLVHRNRALQRCVLPLACHS